MLVQPFSDKQKTLIHWWERSETADCDGIIADGAIRSGKTISMLCGFLLWSQSKFSGKNFIITGVTQSAITRNVIMPMKEILGDWGWSYHHNKGLGYVKIGTNYYWILSGGGDGSQDRMQGMTAAGALADEAALLSEKFLNQMTGRCSVESAKVWFNCNPESPTSFFKTEFIDKAEVKRLLYVHFLMNDNPSLPEAVIDRYERMFDGVFYQRYIEGRWVKAEGIIYPNFEDALEPTYDGDAFETVVSCDYGTMNPFAALLWVKDNDGVWHAVKEYYYNGRATGYQKTDQDYIDDMMAFIDGYTPETLFIVDPSATSFITALRRSGFRVRKAKNSIVDGIRNTSTSMKISTIKISDECKSLISEMQGYVWDDKNDDVPVKENDHACDALRYFVETMKAYRKPEKYVSYF